MSQDTLDTNNAIVEPTQELPFDPVVAAFLRENCQKQQDAIQAIEDSAYVTRHGRRELRDPKRLALAVQLRSKFMAEFIAIAREVLTAERSHTFWTAVTDEIAAESPEMVRKIGRRLAVLNRTYKDSKPSSLDAASQDPTEPGR